MRLIKRYKNRRLYDCRTSRTITQSELARMIEEGDNVRVVDSASGQDITLPVLSRVMVAETAGWPNVIETTEFMRETIRAGGDKSMSILKNTILASIGALQVTKAKAEKVIDELIKKGDLDKSDRKAAVMELLARAEKSTEAFRKKILGEADRAQKGIGKLAKEMQWARQTDLQKLNGKVNKLVKAVKDLQGQLADK